MNCTGCRILLFLRCYILHRKRLPQNPGAKIFQSAQSFLQMILNAPELPVFYFGRNIKRSSPLGYEYSQFCELLSREQKLGNASMHFEYSPDDLVLVDFAGDMLSYLDRESGEVVSCPVLVCVLPFSGYSYAIVLPNATLPLS